MSSTNSLEDLYKSLDNIDQHLNLIKYIKTSSSSRHYNSNEARRLININITTYFEQNERLLNYPKTQMSQTNLLLDFTHWVHIPVHMQVENMIVQVPMIGHGLMRQTTYQSSAESINSYPYVSTAQQSVSQVARLPQLTGGSTLTYVPSVRSVAHIPSSNINDNFATASVYNENFNRNGLLCTDTAHYIRENADGVLELYIIK